MTIVTSYRLVGFAELLRGLDELPAAAAAAVTDEFAFVGSVVAASAAAKTSTMVKTTYASTQRSLVATGAGYTSKIVRQMMVRVEQSRRKKSGRRPDYGAKMMTRALLPARNEELPGLVAGIDVRLQGAINAEGLGA